MAIDARQYSPALMQGAVMSNPVVSKDARIIDDMTVTTLSTASAVTFTAAQVIGGIILRDPNGAGRADLVPTAASVVAGISNPVVGSAFRFTLRNTADAAETITVTTNTGATLSGTMTIAQNNSKDFLAVLTNVTSGSEAYTLYSLGTVTF